MKSGARSILLNYGVKIEFGFAGGFSFGSGVIIDKDTVLTAAHVVTQNVQSGKAATGLTVTTIDGRKFMEDATWKFNFRRRPTKNCSYVDECIITIPNLGGEKLEQAAPFAGDDLFIVGNPNNFGLNVMRGIVGGVTPNWYRNGDPTYMIWAPIQVGNSGGGVFTFDDETGAHALVGVIDANQTQNPLIAGHRYAFATEMCFVEPAWAGK